MKKRAGVRMVVKSMSRGFALALLVVFCGASVVAQNRTSTTIKGTIESIAEDNTSIVIDNQTILVQPQILDDYYIEVGDPVIATIKKKGNSFIADSVTFDFNAAFSDETIGDGTQDKLLSGKTKEVNNPVKGNKKKQDL